MALSDSESDMTVLEKFEKATFRINFSISLDYSNLFCFLWIDSKGFLLTDQFINDFTNISEYSRLCILTYV